MQYSKEEGLLGRLCVGEKKLEGKTFYLDNVKNRLTTLLLEAITLLGGVGTHKCGIKVDPIQIKCIDSYLHTRVCVKLGLSLNEVPPQKQLFCFVFFLKRVESFLHKDVTFVVTGSQDVLKEEMQESGPKNDKKRPGTPRPTVMRDTNVFFLCFYSHTLYFGSVIK